MSGCCCSSELHDGEPRAFVTYSDECHYMDGIYLGHGTRNSCSANACFESLEPMYIQKEEAKIFPLPETTRRDFGSDTIQSVILVILVWLARIAILLAIKRVVNR